MIGGERKDEVDVVGDEYAGAAANERTTEEVGEEMTSDMRIDGRKDVVEEDGGSRSIDGSSEGESSFLAAYRRA